MGLNINLLNAGNYYGKGGAVKNSANVGASVASIFKQGRYEDLKNATINYSQKDNNGKVSIDGALAYSKASMEGMDKDNNGTIDAKDGIDPNLLKMIDADGDGKISNAENTAYTMFMDTLGGNAPDGVLTPEEMSRGTLPQQMRELAAKEKAAGMNEKSEQLLKQADELQQQYSEKIKGFVSGMKLEERDKALAMPTRSNTPGNLGELGLDKPKTQNKDNEVVGLLKQLINLLGGNSKQQTEPTICKNPEEPVFGIANVKLPEYNANNINTFNLFQHQ